jgi:hypothetical protein
MMEAVCSSKTPGKLLPNYMVSLPKRQYSSNGNMALYLDYLNPAVQN